MLWAPLAFILILTLIAIMLNEPGRFRGLPPAPVTEPTRSAINKQAVEATPTLQLQFHRVKNRTIWVMEYSAGDGHRYLFRFGPNDISRLQRELLALQVDPELPWTEADTDRVTRHFNQAFLLFLGGTDEKLPLQ